MKSSLRLLAIILAFVVAGAVVWKVLGSRGAQPEQGTENQAQSANAPRPEPGAQTSSGKDSTAARPAANFAQEEQRGKRSAITKDKATSSTTGSGSIVGTVKSKASGQLVEGAKVQIALRPSGPTDGVPVDRPQWDAVTDAKGEFAVAQLPEGYFSVLAVKDDTAGYATANVSDGEGVVEDIVVNLRPAGALSGKVQTDSGAPIEGAVVFAVPLRAVMMEGAPIGRNISGPSPARVKSDSQGAFTMGPLPEGKWMLAAKADGYAYRESDAVPIGSADVVLTLTKGATIRCVVTLADTGQPAPKVDVTLEAKDSSSDDRTKPTGDIGAVEFSGVSDGKYTLSVQSDTYVLSGEPVTFTISNESDPGEQHLEVITGGSISGRVLDAENKQPIDGAKVRVQSEDYHYVPHEGRSAPDGSYRIEGLPTGLYALACGNAPGYVNVGQFGGTVVSVTAGQAVGEMDILLKRGLAIQGIVLDVAGNPIRNAKVNCEDDESSFDESPDEVFTDSAGSFKLDGLAPFSRVTLIVTKKGYAQEPAEPVSLTDQGTADVRVVLGIGASVSGTVVDDEGNPDPNVFVFAQPAESHRWTSNLEGIVDGEGGFVIDGLAPGTYNLRTGFSISGPGEPVQVARGQNVTGIRLVANRGTDYGGDYGSHGTLTISGRVTNRKGEPIRDAQVMAMMSGDGFGTGHAETDKEGGYTVSGLAEGGYKVSVTASRYSSPERIEIAAGSSGVNFVMDLLAKVSGQVVDAATGEPIMAFKIAQRGQSDDDGDIDLMYSRMAYMGSAHQFVSFSDPEGRFQLDRVELKDTILLAQAPGHSPAKFPLTGLRPGETKQGVVIRMDAGASVSGVVKDSQGNPIAGAAVFAGAVETIDTIGETPTTSTDASGGFHLDSLAPGDLHLNVTHREYAANSTSIVTQAGQVTQAEIVLAKGGIVSGTVRRGGKPVPGLDVSAFSMSEGEMGDSRDATTDANGTYTLAGLAPGEAHVSVQLSFDLSIAMSFRSKSRTVTVEADKVTTADFDLTTGTAIVEGKVTSDGQPARMAMVAVLPSGADAATPETLGENMMEAASMTDADGSFRIEGLTAGKVTLMVTVIGGASQAADSDSSDVFAMGGVNSRTVTVQMVEGQTTHQDIELSGGSKVSGTVSGLSAGETAMVYALRGDIDLSGANLFTAMAHVDKYAGMATSNAEGVYTVKGLEPGRYTIAAIAADSKTGPDPAHPRFTTGGVTVSVDGEAKLDLKIP